MSNLFKALWIFSVSCYRLFWERESLMLSKAHFRDVDPFFIGSSQASNDENFIKRHRSLDLCPLLLRCQLKLLCQDQSIVIERQGHRRPRTEWKAFNRRGRQQNVTPKLLSVVELTYAEYFLATGKSIVP